MWLPILRDAVLRAAPRDEVHESALTVSFIPTGRERFLAAMGQLGVDVSRETADRLEALVATLERWQKAINLVSRTTLGDVWRRHVLDSAQLKPLIPAEAKTLVDLGSGAGFPGLVVAALRPDLEVTLIESDARKAAFLGEAARRMMLEKLPKILIGRVEAVPPARADVITARALAPLGQLLAWADRHRTDTAICLFHKGKGWQAEVTEAMKDWDIPLQAFNSVTDLDAVILRIGPYRATALRDR
ncbi:MAG: 16S rRNA (guanine(527)-N(7))-methyltransferase RsmG [Reyranella sp.]